MLHLFKVIALRLAIIAVASVAFAYVLLSIHDYPQTRQAFYDYDSGNALLWTVGFYFVNEASSGIKYTLTGNERHLAYFPRTLSEHQGSEEFHNLLFAASAGDWMAQLQLSHLFALGWNTKQDRQRAVEWYLRSEKTAQQAGAHQRWKESFVREKVGAILREELQLHRLQVRFRAPTLPKDGIAQPQIIGERA